MTIEVILIDDHTLVREGLIALLNQQDDIRIVGETADAVHGVYLAQQLRPQVVVLDVAMPGLSGIDATVQLRETCPKLRVLALSMHADGVYVRGMVNAGASGYLLKDSAFGELVTAIRAVARGRRFFSPGLRYVPRIEENNQTHADLTQRETEVLRMLANGMRTTQIAEHLQISTKTVETYRHRMMTKLQLDTVAAMVKYAIRHGLVSVE